MIVSWYLPSQLSKRVLQAVQSNSVIMEAVRPHSNGTDGNSRPGHVRSSSIPEGAKCALSEASDRECTHRMRLGEEAEWLYISQSCRDKVSPSVCGYQWLLVTVCGCELLLMVTSGSQWVSVVISVSSMHMLSSCRWRRHAISSCTSVTYRKAS